MFIIDDKNEQARIIAIFTIKIIAFLPIIEFITVITISIIFENAERINKLFLNPFTDTNEVKNDVIPTII